MKMIYIDNVRMPSERAHSYQIAQWCFEMGRLGHEVILVTPDRANSKDVFTYYGFTQRTFTHIVLPTFDALRYRWIPQSLAYSIQRWTFLRNARRWAISQNADIWYTRSPAVIASVAHPARHCWVLEVHDDPASNLLRWQRIKKNIKLFIAISEGVKKHLIHLGIGGEVVVVAHDGVDVVAVESAPLRGMRAEWNIPPEAFVAVYTGGLYLWKGVDFLVKAWPATPPEAHLIIVGGPDQDRERVSLQVPPEVRQRVHIFASIPRERVFSLLKEAQLGLLPTSPAFAIGRDYTSPLKVFEYLAAGLPILASSVPTSHELLKSDVARFFLQDPVSLGSQVVQIMKDVKWRSSATATARKRAQEYTWHARAQLIAKRLDQDFSSF